MPDRPAGERVRATRHCIRTQRTKVAEPHLLAADVEEHNCLICEVGRVIVVSRQAVPNAVLPPASFVYVYRAAHRGSPMTVSVRRQASHVSVPG